MGDEQPTRPTASRRQQTGRHQRRNPRGRCPELPQAGAAGETRLRSRSMPSKPPEPAAAVPAAVRERQG